MQFQKKSSEYAVANLVQLGQVQHSKMTRNLTIDAPYRSVRDANPIEDPKSHIPVLSAANPSRWSFSNIMSRVTDYMVADLALGACVMHPEAMLLLSETVANRNTVPPETGSVVSSASSQAAWSRTTIEGPARQPMHKTAPYRLSQPQEAQPIILGQPANERFIAVEEGEIGAGRWTTRLAIVAGSLYAKWQGAREIRRGAAELHSMDDRILKDIGISRSEIDQMARRGRLKN